jgi:hypothetical protein
MSENVTQKPWGFIVHTDTGDIPVIKDRRLYVADEDFSLSPDSLVGSAFHVLLDGEMVWQGVVVAEPQPGRYLCHIDKLDASTENVQRLFSLDTLMGYGDEGKRLLEGAMAEARAPIVDPSLEWRLYDNEEAARQAYASWLTTKMIREELS